jgi:streptogramin lyase
MKSENSGVAALVTHIFDDVSKVHGVTFDGHSVWFACDDGDFVEADPGSGAVRSRTRGFGSRAGAAFDGSHLWLICGKDIHRVDPKTRAAVATIPNPEPKSAAGMAWAEGALWIGLYDGKKILKVDPATGRVLKTVAVNRFVTGVTWAGDELWHGGPADGAEGDALHRVDPETGAHLMQLLPTPQTDIAGVEYDAQRDAFWFGALDEKKGSLRAVRKPHASPRLRSG